MSAEGSSSGAPLQQLPASYFTLEDAELTRATREVLSCFAILGAAQPELPILYASSGCRELCGGSSRAAVTGTGLAQALQLSPESAERLAAALENCSAVCLRLQASVQPLEATFLPVAEAGSGLLLYWLACFGRPAAVAAASAPAAAQAAADEQAEQDVEPAGSSGRGSMAEAAEEQGQGAAEGLFAPAVFTLSSAGACPEAGPTVEALCERFIELLGHSAAALGGGGGWRALCGPDTAAEVLLRVEAAIAAHQPGAWPLLLYRSGGHTCRWFLLHACPVPSGTVVLLTDVTAANLKRIGPYSVGRVIGQGTYGIVRVGRHQDTGELVALKMVDTRTLKHIDELRQLQDEIAVLAALRHPRIIRLHGVQQVQERICLVMEYAPGGSLKAYMDLQEGRALSEERARHLFEQMVSAVDYCHRRRVVHRDIKPENILLDERGDIKIADFGLAGITTPFDDKLSETCGTVEFIAPEVFTQQGYNGAAADMWSLGAVLYEMLQGHSPFKAPSSAAIIKAACKGVYAPLPDHISAACKHLLAGLLSVNPAARTTMEQLVCHPWLLGESAALERWEAAPGCPADTPTGVAGGSLLDDGEGMGACEPCSEGLAGRRHDSLRLVLPGMEHLPPVPEEGEARGAPGAPAQAAKPASPRRSLNAGGQPGSPAAARTRSDSSKSSSGAAPAAKEPRRSRSSAGGSKSAPNSPAHLSRSISTVHITFSEAQQEPAGSRRGGMAT